MLQKLSDEEAIDAMRYSTGPNQVDKNHTTLHKTSSIATTFADNGHDPDLFQNVIIHSFKFHSTS